MNKIPTAEEFLPLPKEWGNLIINMIEYLSIKNILRKVGKGRNIWQKEEEKRRSNKLI